LTSLPSDSGRSNGPKATKPPYLAYCKAGLTMINPQKRISSDRSEPPNGAVNRFEIWLRTRRDFFD